MSKRNQIHEKSARRYSVLSTQSSVLSSRRSSVGRRRSAVGGRKLAVSGPRSAVGIRHSAPPPLPFGVRGLTPQGKPSPPVVGSYRLEGEGRGGGASALSPQSSSLSLRIADITLSIHSTDPSLKLQLQGATKNFSTQGGNADITVEIGRDDLSGIETGDKRIFDSGGTWQLYATNGNYKFYFYSEAMGPVPYKTAEVQKNFSRARVFLHKPYFDLSQPIYPLEYPLDELLFVHFLSQGRGVEVHACGVLDAQGKGHLFIGQSGAGKSTMAGLWKDQPGITILSDDRIVLRKMNGRVWMYGTPWHGEGRFFSASRSRLSRIYFLEKGKKDEVTPYRTAEAIGRLTACSFLPFYNPAALDFTMSFFEQMVKTVPAGELKFVPEKGVVDLIKGLSNED